MSWHFSQALGGGFLAANCVASAPSAPSSTTPTHGTFWSPGKTTDVSPRSRSGMTYAPLPESHGEALLTWCQEASRARTSPPPAKAQELQEREAGFGPKCLGSLAKFDPDSHSWKTHQFSLLGGLESFSATWPRWGMMRNGECWELSTPAHLTNGTESGLWQNWPTPAARDCKGSNSREHCETNGTGRKHMDQLANAVAFPDLRFATPQARDFRTGQQSRWENPERTRNLNDQIGGQLNPTWVEWLMGWPIGWTDCAASATAKFRLWCLSHGVSLPPPDRMV